jgi:predicted RNA-binding protein YlxR (DUF448 family)/ribosomal protein L30E
MGTGEARHVNAESVTTSASKTRRDRPDRRERTCVGCGERDTVENVVRLVVSDEGEVAVDLAGGRFGRGAHLHPSPRCLERAPRGLARTFKKSVDTTPEQLATALLAAADRRALGLIASAARSGRIEIGGEMAGKAIESGKAQLLVVARDAQSAASLGAVMRAVAAGNAVAWGTKEQLGRVVGKSEVAVLGIVSQSLAVALRATVMLANSVAQRAGMATEGR